MRHIIVSQVLNQRNLNPFLIHNLNYPLYLYPLIIPFTYLKYPLYLSPLIIPFNYPTCVITSFDKIKYSHCDLLKMNCKQTKNSDLKGFRISFNCTIKLLCNNRILLLLDRTKKIMLQIYF